MIQIDATPFQWFKKWGDTQYYALHGAIDDATGKMVAMYMTRFENTHGYFEMVRQIFKKYGKPMAFYSDKAGIFHPTNKAEPTIEEQLQGYTKARTQWEKVMEDVGVASILANSPQAKGRIEHSWLPNHQYLLFDIQDRGWKTVNDVNAHIQEYIDEYNAMFAIKQTGDTVAWRKTECDWEEKICKRYIRVVDSGNCISFRNSRLLIDTPVKRNAKIEIRVSEHDIWARYNNKNYTVTPINSINNPQKAMQYIIDKELYQDEKCG